MEIKCRSPWNSNYCTESGQVLFKAESPWSSSLLGRNIKISRVVPPSEVGNDFTQSLAEEAALRDVFEPLGEIEYHFFKNSRIRYRGVDQPVNQLFRQVGFGFYGRHRLFTGPDGREYVWKMNPNVCKLYLNDSAKTQVATFHRKHYGIFSPKRPASLEIFSPGKHMVELILITFVYMEKLRKDKEGSRNSNCG